MQSIVMGTNRQYVVDVDRYSDVDEGKLQDGRPGTGRKRGV